MWACWSRVTSLSNLLLIPPFPFPCAQDCSPDRHLPCPHVRLEIYAYLVQRQRVLLPTRVGGTAADGQSPPPFNRMTYTGVKPQILDVCSELCFALRYLAEADKRRHDDRRGYQRPSQEPRYLSERYENHDQRRHYSDYRAPPHLFDADVSSSQRRDRYSVPAHRRPQSSRDTKISGNGDSRVLSSGVVIRHQDIPIVEPPLPLTTRAAGVRPSGSLLSHTPSPRNLRERLEYPNDLGSTGRTPTPNSRERHSALDRVAEQDLRARLSPRPTSSLDSGRLQEVEIQYDGGENQQYISPNVPSGSSLPPRVPLALRLSDADAAGPSNTILNPPAPQSKAESSSG
ncbi:hypothetical protein F2Q70_00009770 [Brassica cretica]|uniref:Uncharacterized protein n=1 Tax=Brassica cretica TaxID=69181 RepID=A0A8S9LRM5_BRACR|nr:hypothetical protein F2Q70_00009770 [Brassica cretica]